MDIEPQVGNLAFTILRWGLSAGIAFLFLWGIWDLFQAGKSAIRNDLTFRLKKTRAFCFKVVGALVFIMLLNVLAVSGPRLTLDVPERKAAEPSGKLSEPDEWGQGWDTRKERMRTLDAETDSRVNR